jgi:hypothetical protein
MCIYKWGKPVGKRPLGRPRRRWVDNIAMDLGEVGWGDVDWIGLAQDRNRWRACRDSYKTARLHIGPASKYQWPLSGPRLHRTSQYEQLARESVSQSESELLYNWRSVSQFVLGLSPIWDFWPEIYFFFKLQSCLNWGALSDERSGLSFVSLQSVYSSQSVFT